MRIILELIDFTIKRKKYWLLPIILVTSIFGFLIIMTEGSALYPFVYTLF